MKRTRLLAPILATVMLLALVSDSAADISSASVLFLRIAPGSRSAGMGEAYVAIAEDATANHWNPAGLGTYPLASGWEEVDLSEDIRPLKAMAALRTGAAGSFQSYDIWAITGKGLARYDHKNWHFGELFRTRTDQTVRKIVASYLNVTDEDKLARLVEKVAIANNAGSVDRIGALRDKLMPQVAEDYSQRDFLSGLFDSLNTAYDQCKINWDRFQQAERLTDDAMKDGSMSEVEIDRISFAVEKTKNRFIPEEIVVPYSIDLSGEMTSIAATEKQIVIGTNSGLVIYDGKRWQTLTVENGLPSNNVLCLQSSGPGEVFIGTDNGPARLVGATVFKLSEAEQLPDGPVSAIWSTSSRDIWAVINNDLYHFDGSGWANSFEYTVAIDDSPESIAQKFSIYGTPAERQLYMDKLNGLLVPPVSETLDPPPPPPAVATDSASPGEIATEEALGETGTEAYPESITPATGESGIAGVAQSVDVPQAYSLEPGNKIRVPYLAGFKGKVTTIHARGNTLWVGTEYGVLRFSQSGWSVPGYKDHVVEEGQTLDDIAALKGESNPDHLAAYKSALVDINDLDGAPLVAGEMLKVYRNPAAAHTFKIMSHQEATYFATGDGLFMFDGQVFNRVPLGGMQYANAVDIQNVNGELWFGGSSRIVVRATGRSELSMMYVKWLPDLADDLYYAYLSGVFGIGDLGTFGLSTSFISYGTITRTKNDPTPVGTFESFDVAVAGSYGTSLTNKLKGGITAKIIYSKLSDQGAGSEKGKGTSTGFGVDLGLMYLATDRLKFGMAVTNLGPNMTYINAAQSDPLPRNLGLGFSYKLLQSDYYYLLTTAEVNKLLVGLNDGVSEEIKQVVYNGGAEFMYANIFAVRAGYIFDEEGKIKSPTFGAGISPANLLKFDFAYIPSGTSSPLANTLRVSMSFLP